jgi:hypothetical protein
VLASSLEKAFVCNFMLALICSSSTRKTGLRSNLDIGLQVSVEWSEFTVHYAGLGT